MKKLMLYDYFLIMKKKNLIFQDKRIDRIFDFLIIIFVIFVA